MGWTRRSSRTEVAEYTLFGCLDGLHEQGS
jgi:hypothetical protein